MGHILVPLVTQLFRSKWLNFSIGALRKKWVILTWKVGSNFSSTSDSTFRIKMTQFFSLGALSEKNESFWSKKLGLCVIELYSWQSTWLSVNLSDVAIDRTNLYYNKQPDSDSCLWKVDCKCTVMPLRQSAIWGLLEWGLKMKGKKEWNYYFHIFLTAPARIQWINRYHSFSFIELYERQVVEETCS